MRLDLRSERVELQPELADHALRQRLPVHARIGGQMRVVVADRAVDLSGYRHRRKYGRRALQTGNRVGDFLPERRRRSGLAMRPRKHRQLGERASELTQVVAKRIERRQQHVLACAAQHQAMREIVDVFRRACEMDEFRHVRDFRNR